MVFVHIFDAWGVFHEDRGPEEVAAIVLDQVQRAHDVPAKFVVVQVARQDGRKNWEENIGLRIVARACHLSQMQLGRGRQAEGLDVAENNPV